MDRPVAFDNFSEEEQQWRLRLYLATWAMGASRDLSWAAALDDDPAHVAESQVILAGISDEALREAAMTRRDAEVRQWWDGLVEDSQGRVHASRVTILTRVT
jgi:hypothetical protein